MKYIKTFENLDQVPQIGDYVIVDIVDQSDPDYMNFINSSIGYIWKKPTIDISLVKYDDIPKNILKNFQFSDYSQGLKIGNSVLMKDEYIKKWSKNKKDLIPIISANKYNL